MLFKRRYLGTALSLALQFLLWVSIPQYSPCRKQKKHVCLSRQGLMQHSCQLLRRQDPQILRTTTCLRTSNFPELLYSESSCSYASKCNGGPYAKTGKWISSYMTAATSTKWKKKKSKLGNIECFWRRGASSCISHRLIEVMKRGRGERRVESPRNNTPACYRNTRGKEKERGGDLLFIENSKLLGLSSLLCKSPDGVVASIGPMSPCCFKGKC